MDLQEIVKRYADGLAFADTQPHPRRVNPRTGVIYLTGVKSLPEQDAVHAVTTWWGAEFSSDFIPPNGQVEGVKYNTIPRAKCDHVFTTDHNLHPPEWAVEVKHIALIGDNGKRNDYAVAKVLSPFLKDRSLLHDVVRLRSDPPARRLAVIGYTFDYDLTTCTEARLRHPEHPEEIQNIEDVVNNNGGVLSIQPLLNFADGILRVRNFVVGPMCQEKFLAWRHPCGGRGLVFGWEISNPNTTVGFDPRHPW